MIQSDDIADLFGEEQAPAPEQEADGPGPKILVVDDSRMMRFAVAEVIRKLGYGVLEAADGDEALALADDDQPQLIFLDINMPRMSGIDVLERLRSDSQLQTVPVVILTVEKCPDLMRRVAALRVKDYLLKPARPSEIKRRVASYLTGLSRSRQPGSKSSIWSLTPCSELIEKKKSITRRKPPCLLKRL